MDDPTIAGALLGAAITAIAAALIFVAERIASAVTAYRTQRRIAFEDVIQAFTTYAEASIGTGKQPDHTVGGRMLSSHARLLLALGRRERKIGWWVSGMQRHMGDAAAPNHDKQARIDAIEDVLGKLINSLIDLHTGRLLTDDFIKPASVFWAEAQGVDVEADSPGALAVAMRPRPMGRPRAYRERAIMTVLTPTMKLGAWLGFTKSLGLNVDITAPK